MNRRPAPTGEARAATAAPAAAPLAPSAVESVRRLSSEQLFDGASEVHIEHGGALYRLKRTALGKLILTK